MLIKPTVLYYPTNYAKNKPNKLDTVQHIRLLQGVQVVCALYGGFSQNANKKRLQQFKSEHQQQSFSLEEKHIQYNSK